VVEHLTFNEGVDGSSPSCLMLKQAQPMAGFFFGIGLKEGIRFQIFCDYLKIFLLFRIKQF
jgi:hypothetical protein